MSRHFFNQKRGEAAQIGDLLSQGRYKYLFVYNYDSNNYMKEFYLFRNKKTGLNGAVRHYLTVKEMGDDEVIKIEFNKLPPIVHSLAVTINSYSKKVL